MTLKQRWGPYFEPCACTIIIRLAALCVYVCRCVYTHVWILKIPGTLYFIWLAWAGMLPYSDPKKKAMQSHFKTHSLHPDLGRCLKPFVSIVIS